MQRTDGSTHRTSIFQPVTARRVFATLVIIGAGLMGASIMLGSDPSQKGFKTDPVVTAFSLLLACMLLSSLSFHAPKKRARIWLVAACVAAAAAAVVIYMTGVQLWYPH